MGKYSDVDGDYNAYQHGLSPWHIGPDYTDEEARKLAGLSTSDNSSDLENSL